jgi:steroid delta-isomerase-like uncharacterized protein
MERNEVLAIVEAMAAAWNRGDLDGCVAFLTDDVVWDDPAMPAAAAGRAAVRSFSEAVLRAFPDFRYTIRGPVCVAEDGSRCAVPWRIEATHTATLTPPGYGPTGRRAVFEGVDLLELREDRVARIDTYFNPLVAAEQLLDVSLRPAPGSWRERLLVGAQRLRASWLRGRFGRG